MSTFPGNEFALTSVTLQDVAKKVGTSLQLSRPLEDYEMEDGAALQLGLAGAHQRVNASLAVALAAAWEAAYATEVEATGAGLLDTVAGTAKSHAELVASGKLPASYIDGLRACEWPGRAQVHTLRVVEGGGGHRNATCICGCLEWSSAFFAQVVEDEVAASCTARPLTFYLDGAHTQESMATCAQWFADAVNASAHVRGTPQRILLFNCMQVLTNA
jgi:folylpolyglutamate synthase